MMLQNFPAGPYKLGRHRGDFKTEKSQATERKGEDENDDEKRLWDGYEQ